MILIPELQTVVILEPRTGSGSLRRAIAARYPNAMMIYRHMEACGVPQGYERWMKIGVIRHPVDRLFSLYKFLQTFSGDHAQAYIDAMRASVQRPFDDWLLNNEIVFTSPYDRTGGLRFYPQFTVRHALPENRKSQFVYLRPDLGTRILPFGPSFEILRGMLDIDIGHHHATGGEHAPRLPSEAVAYVNHAFAWDIEALNGALHSTAKAA